MKNLLILHGTDATPDDHWFPWLQQYGEERGWKVWVPQLPNAHTPNTEKCNDHIFKSDWEFSEESYIVGHSAGAVETLALLQTLPDEVTIDTAVLVGSFRGDLGWPELRELAATELDLKKIKQKAKRFVIFHSDNDPFCPLEDAEYYAKELGGELIVVPGAQHFTPYVGGDTYWKAEFVTEVLHL